MKKGPRKQPLGRFIFSMYAGPMRPIFLLAALLALPGCVSTEMKQYVGRDISDAMISYGPPERIIELPDGRRAYQFRSGGGAIPVAGSTTSTFSGNTVTTTGTLPTVLNAPGCLLTFIAVPSGSSWQVVEMRVPKQAIC